MEELTSVNAEQVSDEGSQQEQAAQAEKVEVAAPQQEKPVQTAEDNAKYAAIRREAESKAREKARDELIAEMYGDYGIKTYADYQKAITKQKEEEELAELSQKIPEEVAKELLEIRKFREQYEQEKLAKAEQAKREAEYKEFLETYPDVKPEEIPAEVWEQASKGKSLLDAYARHENKLLKEKLAKLSETEEQKKKNAENAQSTTGSVTGNGAPNVKHFTREQVEKMTTEEVMKNYKTIMESRATW